MCCVRRLLIANGMGLGSISLHTMNVASLRQYATRPFRFIRQCQAPEPHVRFVEFTKTSISFGLSQPSLNIDGSEDEGPDLYPAFRINLCPGGRWALGLSMGDKMLGVNFLWELVIWDLTSSTTREGSDSKSNPCPAKKGREQQTSQV